jgi:hypothetical protein
MLMTASVTFRTSDGIVKQFQQKFGGAAVSTTGR